MTAGSEPISVWGNTTPSFMSSSSSIVGSRRVVHPQHGSHYTRGGMTTARLGLLCLPRSVASAVADARLAEEVMRRVLTGVGTRPGTTVRLATGLRPTAESTPKDRRALRLPRDAPIDPGPAPTPNEPAQTAGPRCFAWRVSPCWGPHPPPATSVGARGR